MPSKNEMTETCPICETGVIVSERTWFYTCIGCGSGINLIGIWWKERSGKDWMGLSENEKKKAGNAFFQRSHNKKWKDVILEI